MRKNVLFVFLCLSLFWGGVFWILFNIKIGVLVGLIAGILGIFYYSIFTVGSRRKVEGRREK